MSHKMILSKDITVEVICNTFVLWNNLMPNLSLKIFIKIYRPSSLVPIQSITSGSPTSRCGAPEVDISASGAPHQDTSTSPFHILAPFPSLPFSHLSLWQTCIHSRFCLHHISIHSPECPILSPLQLKCNDKADFSEKYC